MPNTFSPGLLAKPLLDEKMENVSAKAAEKREVLDPIQTRLDRQNNLAQARIAQMAVDAVQIREAGNQMIQDREDAYDAERSTPIDKFFKDALLKAGQAGTAIVGNVLAAGTDAATSGIDKAINTMASGPEALSEALRMGDPERAYGPAPSTQIEEANLDVAPDIAPEISKINRKISEVFERSLSKQGRASAKVSAAKQAAEKNRNELVYQAALAAGNNKLASQLARETKNLVSGFVNAIDDPNNLVNNLAAAAPSVAIAAMSGGAAGPLGVMAATGAMEGAGAYQQVADQITATPLADLQQQFPDVLQMIEDGADEDAVRSYLVSEVGLPAAATTGIAAALISKISMPFALNPLGLARKAAVKEAAPTGVAAALSGKIPGLVQAEVGDVAAQGGKGLLRDILGEATEEASQGAAAQMLVNQANRSAGNTNVELLDNTGAAVGQGLATGGLMPVAMQSPAIALQAVAGAVEGAGETLRPLLYGPKKAAEAAVQAAGKLSESRADGVREKTAAPAKAAQAEALNSATKRLKANMAQAGMDLDLQPVLDKMSTETQEYLATSTERDLDSFGLANILIQKAQDKNASEQAKADLPAGLVLLDHKMANSVRTASKQLAAEQEKPAEAQDVQLIAALTEVVKSGEEIRQHPVIQNARANAADTEVTDTLRQQIQSAVESGNLIQAATPEVQQAAQVIRTKIAEGRLDGLDSKTVDGARMLYSEDLDGDEQASFTTASSVLGIIEEHDAENEKKGIEGVRGDVTQKGFTLITPKGLVQLRSLKDFGKEILALANNGKLGEARVILSEMKTWVDHQNERAMAVNEAATAQLKDYNETGQWGENRKLKFRQLDEDQISLSKNKQFVNLAFAGGQQTAQAVEVDSRTITRAYNALANRVGGIAAKEVAPNTWEEGLEATNYVAPAKQASESQEGASKADTKPTGSAEAPKAPQAGTEGKAPESGARAADGERTRSEAEVDDQKPKSRITPEQGKRLSDAGLNERLGLLMDKRMLGEATPEDDATFVVLDAEMSERETAAAQRQADEEASQATQGIDFNSEAPASEADMAAALELTKDDYMKAVGGGQVAGVTSDKAARELLAQESPSEEANEIGKVGDTSIVLMADGNRLYAVDTAQQNADGVSPTVGMLVVTDAGTTLVVHPDGNGQQYKYRKMGIGTALMRELLKRNPMAKAGGLSAVAKEIRWNVLNEFRAARRVPVADSTEARYPGVIPQLPNQEGPLARNRFLQALKFMGRSLSMFGQKKDALTQLREALAKGPKGLRAFVPGEVAGVLPAPTEETVERLTQLVEKFLPQVKDQLNRNLNDSLTKLDGYLNGENGADKALGMWTAADKLSLHAAIRTVNDDGTVSYTYQPEVLDAMAMSALRWVIDQSLNPRFPIMEQIAEKFPNKEIPAKLVPYFESQILVSNDIETVARDLQDALALQSSSAVSRSWSEGLMQALAADAILALTNVQTRSKKTGEVRSLGLGWVKVTRVPPGEVYALEKDGLSVDVTGQAEILADIAKMEAKLSGASFTFRSLPQFTNEEETELSPLGEMTQGMEDSLDWLDALLAPKERARAFVGRPPNKKNARVKGSLSSLGTEQEQMEDSLGKTVFTINPLARSFFYRLNINQLQKLFGREEYDPANTNKGHLKSLRGKATGARITTVGLYSLLGRVERYAATSGRAVTDVPVHWAWRILSNGRAGMEGFGPQASKWMRITFIPTKRTLDLNNDRHMRNFWLAIGQALNIKVEGQDHNLTIRTAQEAIQDPEKYGELVGMLRASMESEGPLDDAGDRLVQKLLDMEGKFSELPDGLNALMNFIALQQAIARGETKFTTTMSYEIDGKTNGVINLLMQMGLSFLDSRMLRQLAQGGIFIGRAERDTLNENPKQGDVYKAAVAGFPQIIREIILGVTDRAQQLVIISTAAALARPDVERMVFTAGGTYDAVRNLFKNPMTQSVYGAELHGIMVGLAREVASSYLAEIQRALDSGQGLSAQTIKEITDLFGYGYSKKGKRYPVYLGALNSREDLLAFNFNNKNIMALTSNLTMGVGAAMTKQIDKELGGTRLATGTLTKLSQFQAFAAKFVFDKLYTKRRNELIKAGELTPNDALSADEETKIIDQVRPLMALYQTNQTAGTDGKSGILVGQKERTGLPALSGKGRHGENGSVRVTGVAGQLSSDMPAMSLEADVGVSVLANLNIASGDASMMGRFFQRIQQALNVFDGLNVGITDMDQASVEINQAASDSWDFDLLGEFLKQVKKFKFDFKTMDRDTLIALAKQLRYDKEDEGPESLQQVIEDNSTEDLIAALELDFAEQKKTLETLVKEARVVKRVLREVDFASDQMAGPGAPYRRPGTRKKRSFDTQEEALEYVQQRVIKLLGYAPLGFAGRLSEDERMAEAEAVAANLRTELDETQVVDLSLLAFPKKADVTVPTPLAYERSGAELVTLLDAHKFENKLVGHVYKAIRKLIPAGLQVISGTPEQMSTWVSERRPDLVGYDFSKRGGYADNFLFLRSDQKGRQREYTLIHELLHATTRGIIRDYYDNGGKRLTGAQREAIKNLEALARYIIQLEPTDLKGNEKRVFGIVQNKLKELLDANRIGDMVEELMAHTLTHPHMQKAAGKIKGPLTLRVITQKVLDSLRKLFGLAKNPSIESFLVQTLGQTHRILSRNIPDVEEMSGNQLNLEMPVTAVAEMLYSEDLDEDGRAVETETEKARLAELAKGFDRLMLQLPETQEVGETILKQGEKIPYTREEARLVGKNGFDRMELAGWEFTELQGMLYRLVHSATTALQALDPLAMDELQQVYQQVIRELQSEDLIPAGVEPTEAVQNVAKARLDSLRIWNDKDAHDRSPLLANFVALAAVNPILRAHLQKQQMKQREVDTSTVNDVLRSGTQRVLDMLGDRILKVHGKSQRMIVDQMLSRMLHAKRDAMVKGMPGLKLVQWSESHARSGINWLYTKANAVLDAQEELPADASKVRTAGRVTTNLLLRTADVLLSPESNAAAQAQAYTDLVNENVGSTTVREFIFELMGTNDTNREEHRLLNRGKQEVAQIRQRLREQVPAMLDKWFDGLGRKDQELLHRSFGKSDAAALIDSFSMDKIQEMLTDDNARGEEINKLVAQLPQNVRRRVMEKATALSKHMMGIADNTGDLFLGRNATAIRARVEVEIGTIIDESMIPVIDQLTTLLAIGHLTKKEAADTAFIMKTKPEGAQRTLQLLGALVKLENSRNLEYGMGINAWKGFIPEVNDSRTDVVLASEKQGEELLQRGYTRVGNYVGDSEDGVKLAYYTTKMAGGLATYNQGALQTVEKSLGGVDALTGRSLGSFTQGVITLKDDVEAITNNKWSQMRRASSTAATGLMLLPIYNASGRDIIGWERSVDRNLLSSTVKSRYHLGEAIGAWMGRQAEESQAELLNKEMLDQMVARWEADKGTAREDQYVAVHGKVKDVLLKDTWDAIPRHMQAKMMKAFNGPVMVRMDLKNNSLGYRSPSVADIFTGTSGLSADTRKALENIAFALAGKRAYTLLVTGERAWQGVIGTAKDIIVVRSGVVAVANLVANQIQLLHMTGWNPARLLRVQLQAQRELEHYMRNQARRTELKLLTTTTKDNEILAKLEAEEQSLVDANARMSIAPLLRAGMLPTIAEGVTEIDQFTLVGDGMRWVEERAESLPKGILTAAKYAVVAKDTALYQGLNRMVQFGDFMAKAAMYQAFMEKTGAAPGSELEGLVLDEVNESFVNYNLLAGRTRDALESMGVTWFWNYKLRIQKIALRQMKRNPLSFFALGLAGEGVGLDTLMSSSAPAVSWGYSIGPDQLTRAHQTLIWQAAW